jgi:hypothetical protein
MRLVLSNGRQFIIRVKYSTEYKCSRTKDKFQRTVYTEWEEHNTALSITEWFKKKTMSKVKVTGYAHCNYQDHFDKNIGKGLAYFRAIEQLETFGIISHKEAEEMASFKLDCAVFKCGKK